MKKIFLLGILLLFMFGCIDQPDVNGENETEIDITQPEPESEPQYVEPEPETIYIGFVGPLSGEYYDEGSSLERAALLAIDEINEGRKNYVFELVSIDSLCTREGAEMALEELIGLYEPQYVIGGVCQSELEGMAPILEENRIFMVNLLTEKTEDNKYITILPVAGEEIGRGMAQYAVDNTIRRITPLIDSSSTALSILDAFKEEAATQNLAVLPEEKIDENLESTLGKIKSSQPDALYIITSDPELSAEVILKAKEAGLELMFLGAVNEVSLEVLTAAGQEAEGLIATVPVFDEHAYEVEQFLNSYEAHYAEEPANKYLTISTRDAVYLIADGFDFGNTDGEAIMQYVSSLNEWQGISGYLTFDEGDRVPEYRVVKIINQAVVDIE